jgi:hypothetical protein
VCLNALFNHAPRLPAHSAVTATSPYAACIYNAVISSLLREGCPVDNCMPVLCTICVCDCAGYGLLMSSANTCCVAATALHPALVVVVGDVVSWWTSRGTYLLVKSVVERTCSLLPLSTCTAASPQYPSIGPCIDETYYCSLMNTSHAEWGRAWNASHT